jgi:hypothetical protein
MTDALPSYRLLKGNYPHPAAKSTKDLLDAIGGQPRKEFSDTVNTCALRVSYALNGAGSPIRKLGNLTVYAGGDGKHYIVGVPAMKRYLTGIYGTPKEIYSHGKYAKDLSTMNGQGIVLFDWQGPIAEFGATGHVDLAEISRGIPTCEGHCYFISGPMKAYFWSTTP